MGSIFSKNNKQKKQKENIKKTQTKEKCNKLKEKYNKFVDDIDKSIETAMSTNPFSTTNIIKKMF